MSRYNIYNNASHSPKGIDKEVFWAKYIEPFYLELMNLNVLKKSESEIFLFFDHLKTLAKELNEDVLIELLNDIWRPSKVGAWMIGLSNRVDLKQELIKYLSTEAIHYSEHVLLNLLIIDKQNAATEIVKFIERQTKYFLKTGDFINLERFSIDWGISILRYLDNEYNSDYVPQILLSDWWIELDKRLKELRYYESIKLKFEPNYHLQSIDKLMNLFNKKL